VHHHRGCDLAHDDMGGCLVGGSADGHREFMSLFLTIPGIRRTRPIDIWRRSCFPRLTQK
jgi:hypothetical protein